MRQLEELSIRLVQSCSWNQWAYWKSIIIKICEEAADIPGSVEIHNTEKLPPTAPAGDVALKNVSFHFSNPVEGCIGFGGAICHNALKTKQHLMHSLRRVGGHLGEGAAENWTQGNKSPYGENLSHQPAADTASGFTKED